MKLWRRYGLCRNTRAGAEEFHQPQGFLQNDPEHTLAVCWEDRPTRLRFTTRREPPPLAWGRQMPESVAFDYLGNTPAGAGKTAPLLQFLLRKEKHPRWRGENSVQGDMFDFVRETPPLERGRLDRTVGHRW